MKVNYDGRIFRSVSNSGNGDVDNDTIFKYHQVDDIVMATYSGGAIRFGTLIATVSPEGTLDMRYSHVNKEGQLATGICSSEPEVLPDGRIRLHEEWQWTSGDLSEGSSVIEEIGRYPGESGFDTADDIETVEPAV